MGRSGSSRCGVSCWSWPGFESTLHTSQLDHHSPGQAPDDGAALALHGCVAGVDQAQVAGAAQGDAVGVEVVAAAVAAEDEVGGSGRQHHAGGSRAGGGGSGLPATRRAPWRASWTVRRSWASRSAIGPSWPAGWPRRGAWCSPARSPPRAACSQGHWSSGGTNPGAVMAIVSGSRPWQTAAWTRPRSELARRTRSRSQESQRGTRSRQKAEKEGEADGHQSWTSNQATSLASHRSTATWSGGVWVECSTDDHVG